MIDRVKERVIFKSVTVLGYTALVTKSAELLKCLVRELGQVFRGRKSRTSIKKYKVMRWAGVAQQVKFEMKDEINEIMSFSSI